MTPRLVATDLDGTLVRSDGSVSARTAAALQAVRARGGEVVFVTGRPVRWMADVVADTGLAGLAVCSNGALLVDLATGEPLLRRPLAPADALEAAHTLRQYIPGTAFAVETEAGFAREPGYHPRFDVGLEQVVAPVEELCTAPVLKLLARNEEWDSDAMLDAAVPVLDGRVSVTHSTAAGSGLLEIAAAGVTKASTLERYAASLGIGREDVVAFGDMPNDLAMLAWAGRSWGMANGHADVLAVVDAIAPANDEDGVAQILEQLLAESAA